MKKSSLFAIIGAATAITLAVPTTMCVMGKTDGALDREYSFSQNNNENNFTERGFGGGKGGMQGMFGGGNYEMAENPSEIVTSDVICSAKDLTADYSNATTYVINDSNDQIKISESGTYIVTGTCSDGNITVKKGTTGVVLILKDLDVTSTTGATLSVNKGSEAKIVIEGTVNLTDAENPEDEESTDTEVADAFDGAAIKVKDGANAYITGTGSLVINAPCKNGIKSGDEAGTCLVIDGPDITIDAANDAFNAGYDLTVLSGKITISASDDAIHADRILTIGSENTSGPDINITSCKEGLEGTIVNIFSGNVELTASDDGINAANSDATYASELTYSINITGGTVTVVSAGDGLDSNADVNLIGGKVTISGSNSNIEAGIDFDGSYYLSDDVELNNSRGVSGPDMMPGQMGGQMDGQMGGQMGSQMDGQMSGQMDGRMGSQMNGQLPQKPGNMNKTKSNQVTDQSVENSEDIPQMQGKTNDEMNGQFPQTPGQMNGETDGQFPQMPNEMNGEMSSRFPQMPGEMSGPFLQMPGSKFGGMALPGRPDEQDASFDKA
ncbi:MAG: carbohydrate-binding domain-containing protein [Lachnospiraceae bacterium]|nr:carbohydrate-binding domain-containing protein [Lachnospiraceae bacterium]